MVICIIMNEHYFDNIDTEEKAYWLGFLYADGYNIKNRIIGVKLAIRDKIHVEKFCNSIGVPINKIYLRSPHNTPYMNRVIKSSGSAEINISNRRLADAAYSCGMIPRKSLILKFPTNTIISNNLMRHFIRGYFDGDGCLTNGYANHATRYRVIILSSKDFCEGLCNFVNEELGINMTLWDKKKTNIYKTCISGNIQVKKFMDWIYGDSVVYLDRKFILYKLLCDKSKLIEDRFKNTYSKYNNITFDKSRNKWIANARINKKTKRIGQYMTELEAYNSQQHFLSSIVYDT